MTENSDGTEQNNGNNTIDDFDRVSQNLFNMAVEELQNNPHSRLENTATAFHNLFNEGEQQQTEPQNEPQQTEPQQNNQDLRDCGDCGESINIAVEDYHRRNGEFLCQRCYDNNYFTCENCGEIFHNDDYGDNGLCYHCNHTDDDNNSDNGDFMEYEQEFKIEYSKTFKKNPFKNTCGIEIECLNKDTNNNCFGSASLRDYGFNQIHDGSLSNGGVEFSSMAFNGDLLFNKIEDFCKALKQREFYINKSCGLHIHIAIPKTNDYLKKVIMFYKKFEPQFFRMVSYSRRFNNYCYSLKQYRMDDDSIKTNKNTTQLKQKIYETTSYNRIKEFQKQKYNSKRYCWVNFHSLFYRGTLEIRLHNGTIDSDKINNWLLINLTVLDFLRNVNLNTICAIPNNDEVFLSFFNEQTQSYIKKRWEKFKPVEVEESS